MLPKTELLLNPEAEEEEGAMGIASDCRREGLGLSKTQTFSFTRRMGDIRMSIPKSHFA